MVETSVIPANEQARLESLRSYRILDSQPEAPFNFFAALAAKRFNAPVALISLVDKYRVWYKSSIGLGDLKEVNRQDSLCSMVVLKDAVCSSTDDTHDASLELLGDRFSVQVEIARTDDFLRRCVS